MIMTNTKPCRTCIYGEKWSGVYTCGRAFEKDGTINQGRIPTRTENKCFGYIKKGTRKMNAIIVDKDKKEEVKAVEKTVEKPVESVEKADDKPKKHSWTVGDTETLIHFYNKGAEIKALAEMFEVTETAIKIKLQKLKRSEQWKGHFTDSGTTSKTEIVAEPVTTLEKTKKTKFSIKDLKVSCYDFISDLRKFDGEKEMHEKTNAVMDFINYMEKQVNENE
jgi:hypothetical protein